MKYINKDILEKETGWLYEYIEFHTAIRSYFEKLGHIDLLLEAPDYFCATRHISNYPGSISGRTENNEPYTMILGIKLVMMSKERADKLKALK